MGGTLGPTRALRVSGGEPQPRSPPPGPGPESEKAPAPAAPDDANLAIPEARIGRYQLLRHVASGGMGSVYAAYDPELDRRVALKLLRKSRGSRSDLEVRLQREAK